MEFPHINYPAVAASAVVIFILGGLWYSPAMFSKKWIALMGLTEEQIKAGSKSSMPLMFLLAFLCGVLTSLTLAIILGHFPKLSAFEGACVGALCWLGFAGATSYTTALFAEKSKQLWLIDSGYNLVSFVLAGVILAAWR